MKICKGNPDRGGQLYISPLIEVVDLEAAGIFCDSGYDTAGEGYEDNYMEGI